MAPASKVRGPERARAWDSSLKDSLKEREASRWPTLAGAGSVGRDVPGCRSGGGKRAGDAKGKGKGKRGDMGAFSKSEPIPDKNSASTVVDLSSNESTPTNTVSKKDLRPSEVIFVEIRNVVERNSALQLQDFDFRVRQHFHSSFTKGGVERLTAAVSFVHQATLNKERKDVKCWPAFIIKLLQRFEQEQPLDGRQQRHLERLAAAAQETKVDEAPRVEENEATNSANAPQAPAPSALPAPKTVFARTPDKLSYKLDPGSLDFDLGEWLPWADETAEGEVTSKSSRCFALSHERGQGEMSVAMLGG